MKCIRVGLVGFGFAGRIFQSNVIEAVEGLELAAIVQTKRHRGCHGFSPRRRSCPLSTLCLRTPVSTWSWWLRRTPATCPIARQCLLARPRCGHRQALCPELRGGGGVDPAGPLTRQRLLSVYQNRRWDGDFLTVRKLLDGDQLGRLVKFESHYDRFRQAPRLHAWREDGSPGGGVLFDLGAHLVDQALVLFGVPQSVWASVRVEREGGPVDDAFDLYLHYPASLAQVSSRLRPCARRSRRMAAGHLSGARPRSALYAQRHAGHLSQIRRSIPRRPTCSPETCFLSKPWGVESSGALGNTHHG